MSARRLLLLSFVPFLVAAGGARFHDDARKVRAFEPPVGWDPQPVGSYFRLVGAWETKEGGRLTLVAQKVKAGMTARALASESRPPLERQGLRAVTLSTPPPATDGSDRLALEATLDDGHRFVRQLYVVADGWSYVVTMVGPLSRAPQMRRDFEEAALSLSVGDGGEATPRR